MKDAIAPPAATAVGVPLGRCGATAKKALL
jgi:hypothetical protein